MRTIALEEHFATPAYLDGPAHRRKEQAAEVGRRFAALIHQLVDVGDGPISVYLRENVHYTFSGFNFLPTFLELLLQVGVDRIMFSTDHPYQSMAEGRAFLDRAPVSDGDRERIAHGNAERLFGV
jgi:Amidohydrolase